MSGTALTPPPVERIQAVNHHLRMALDQVSEGVMILEANPVSAPGPRVVYGNAAALRCCGVDAMDFYGAECGRLTTADSASALLDALTEAAEGTTATAHVRLDARTGPVPVVLQIQATRDQVGQVLNFIVTLRKETPPSEAPEAGAASRNGEAPPAPETWQADVIETIRETARYVAHEFNNALTGILLPVQMVIREVPNGGELHSRLQVAYESARRAADLAKDFLDCFRPRAAERERCQPTGLLGRAMRLATCGQNIDATLELGAHLHDIEVDPGQFERIVFNLVRNSSQAMPNGGRLRITARNVSLADDDVDLPDGEYLQISVRDWGPGIPPEYVKHLFHSRFTTKTDGNGCGLPICYQIVREHGGEMQVRSRINVGTEFILYLPACLTPAPPLPLETPPAPPASRLPDVPLGSLRSRKSGVGSSLVRTAPVPVLPPVTKSVVAPPSAAVSAPSLLEPLVITAPVPPPQPESVPVAALAPAVQIAPVVEAIAVEPPLVPVWEIPEDVIEECTAETDGTDDSSDAADSEEDDDGPLSLLVVDDEDGVRRALSQIARMMGFEVLTVGNSDEALQAYRDRLLAARPYSSVLLDLNLRGGLNGVEVFEAIRRMDPDALVVATSGQHSEGDILRYRQLGFAGFLAKPYSLEEFDSVMRTALSG